MNVSGKRVILTGASSGIGAATAAALKAGGATVIGLDRNEPTANVDEYIQIDLASASSIDAAVAKISGGADALINCAGVPPTPGQETVLKVNFIGLRYLTESVIDKLNDNASIVNVASLAGAGWPNNVANVKEGLAMQSFDDVAGFIEKHGIIKDGMTSKAAYPFSKECVIVWTIKNATRWMDRGIRMNSVGPGPVATPILDDFVQSLGEKAAKDIEEGGGAGQAEGIVPAILFFTSDDSNWVIGQSLFADGGVHSKILTEALSL